LACGMKRAGEGQAEKAAKARKADPIAEALAKVKAALGGDLGSTMKPEGLKTVKAHLKTRAPCPAGVAAMQAGKAALEAKAATASAAVAEENTKQAALDLDVANAEKKLKGTEADVVKAAENILFLIEVSARRLQTPAGAAMAAVAGATYEETEKKMTADREELKAMRLILAGPPPKKLSKTGELKGLIGWLEKLGAPEALILSVPVSIGRRDAGPIEAATLALADKLLAEKEAELGAVLDPWHDRAKAVAGDAMGSEIANLFEELQAGQMLVSAAKTESDAARAVFKEKVKTQKAGMKRVDKVKATKTDADGMVTMAAEAIAAFETLTSKK